MINIKDLSKSYGSNEVLKNISSEFLKGNVYGIVGDNGAGKTTLFRCIAGLEEHKGEITADLSPLKNHLGLLLTDPFFFQLISGREYIQLLCNARKVSPGNIDERNIFELPLDRYAMTYSTGMKKKLALMAILMQENEYYILDEPFNGVDIQSNMIITEIIHHLKQLGKTILISSHIYSTLSDTCDVIHLLSNGNFTRTVGKQDFHLLENEMKSDLMHKKIGKLNIK